MCRRVLSGSSHCFDATIHSDCKTDKCVEAQVAAHGSVHLMGSTGHRLGEWEIAVYFYHRFMAVQFFQCDPAPCAAPRCLQ